MQCPSHVHWNFKRLKWLKRWRVPGKSKMAALIKVSKVSSKQINVYNWVNILRNRRLHIKPSHNTQFVSRLTVSKRKEHINWETRVFSESESYYVTSPVWRYSNLGKPQWKQSCLCDRQHFLPQVKATEISLNVISEWENPHVYQKFAKSLWQV